MPMFKKPAASKASSETMPVLAGVKKHCMKQTSGDNMPSTEKTSSGEVRSSTARGSSPLGVQMSSGQVDLSVMKKPSSGRVDLSVTKEPSIAKEPASQSQDMHDPDDDATDADSQSMHVVIKVVVGHR